MVSGGEKKTNCWRLFLTSGDKCIELRIRKKKFLPPPKKCKCWRGWQVDTQVSKYFQVVAALAGGDQRLTPKEASIGGFGWVPKCVIPRYEIGPKLKCRRGYQCIKISKYWLRLRVEGEKISRKSVRVATKVPWEKSQSIVGGHRSRS